MVAKDPLFGHWTAKKFSATVLDDIWPEVTFFTLVATVVSVVSLKTSVDLGVSNQLLTVLGLVLGLVISFRTSSAYERYQDGRKMWTNITVASKNMAQMVWMHVPVERTFPAGSSEAPMSVLQVTIEKKTMINLIQAYAVSVKHLLRGEQGAYYRDLYPLISFLPRHANGIPGTIAAPDSDSELLPLWQIAETDGFQKLRESYTPQTTGGPRKMTDATMVEKVASGSDISLQITPERNGPALTKPCSYDPEAVLPVIESEYVLKPARNPPHASLYDFFPFLRLFRWLWRHLSGKPRHDNARTRKRKAFSEIAESQIPLEILLVLSNYSAYLLKHDLIKPAIGSGLTNNILSLTDSLSNLERICNTPLPFAYQAHLRMSVWIYLLLLPFQIYSFYQIITIPATAFASFLMLGFLEIGQEIENPFNYDMNDLDLDHFCLAIQRDLAEITASATEIPFEHIFSKLNTPLAPADVRHAEELSKMDVYSMHGDDATPSGNHSLRKILVDGWKRVDMDTRKKT
ncbi:hypothetical protein HYPSUDRAFT_44932 [Hypholoma sublateritium FD-334 SS-4]|uniref:Uncharacterized protein n=1 Tax=Hypholoma sublateritium (strain FD-334 SS-4) TaxID=945553 RepID=A0A0D2PF05_HYPSF|nr:hypothetical protein HYPSUDRAFT_44932 [Hypholoma sublateritium FD-334 SS-4]